MRPPSWVPSPPGRRRQIPPPLPPPTQHACDMPAPKRTTGGQVPCHALRVLPSWVIDYAALLHDATAVGCLHTRGHGRRERDTPGGHDEGRDDPPAPGDLERARHDRTAGGQHGGGSFAPPRDGTT